MKLFLREHVMFVCFTLVQLFVVLFVDWLDGYQHPATALYAGFLGIVFMFVYMLLQYIRHRRMYERLSQSNEESYPSFPIADSSAISQALKHLMDNQYRHYQMDMKNWERKQEKHVSFMNQWVHQMKTPLSVIELITQDEDDERLDSISEESERLRQGLEMVLYMSRLETFAQDFSVDVVTLSDVINEVITDYKRLFIRSQVYPEMLVDPNLTVQTDAKWLRFIIQQVLSNAIKYSAGSHKKVTISTSAADRTVQLEIQDRGVGIPQSDINRVFRPFFTGENGRRFKESTGMGLYVVKEVIDKLNHRIEIQSEEGKGTTVTIAFPYAIRKG
jgi:OmpR family two-component system sensor histidine kinase YxdK